ncbi:phage baseplate assembly protein [Sphingomonas sp. UYP23]
MTEDLTLSANGRDIAGWENIAVTLRAEGFPSSFDISLSSRDPSTKTALVVRPGDPCTVKLGSELVATGYVDRAGNGGSAETHTLNVSGRGKTQDLVDCSAEWPGGQISNCNALDIAKKLAAPYGIEVKLANGAEAGPIVPQFAVTYGETAAEIIQRVARNAGLLAYEDASGSLLLTAVGTKQAESGVAYGTNVEEWGVLLSSDQRYSEIVCMMLTQETLNDIDGVTKPFFTAPDPNVLRHRRLYMTLEQAADPVPFTIQKAKWEAARRAGRSTIATATIDSWRDSKGKLFMPNTLIPVSLPGLPDKTPLIISQVTFRRGGDGTHADIVAMPKDAFVPEPINLQPVNLADISAS